MIRAIALDDERPALSILEAFCERIDFVDLRQTFTRTGEARSYLNENPVDLLFADINMPTESGLDFYRATPSRTTPEKSNGSLIHPQPTMVIFTTAYGEYAVESYELQAVDYLLKPFTFERFLQAVNRAADYAARQPRPDASPADAYLTVRADYALHKIALADILFIEGLDNYLKFYLRPLTNTGSHRIITARMTMKALLEKLPRVDAPRVDAPRVDAPRVDAPRVDAPRVDAPRVDAPRVDAPGNAFVRVHRSYIVPIRRIEALQSKTLRIAGHEIPIGATYEKEFMDRFRP